MLPPIDPTQLPPDVRKAGPEAQKLYGAALQFEGMLVQQITDQMFQSVDDGSSDSSSSDGSDDGSSVTTGSSMGGDYQSMLPGTMADAITQDGGLGLADELYRSMALRFGVDTSPAGSGSGTTGDGGTTGGTGSA